MHGEAMYLHVAGDPLDVTDDLLVTKLNTTESTVSDYRSMVQLGVSLKHCLHHTVIMMAARYTLYQIDCRSLVLIEGRSLV